jgi:hypothetical protein
MNRMKLIATIGFSMLLLALACNAIDLSGQKGKNILSDMINSTNSSNESLNYSNATTLKDSSLWSWGKLPAGYSVKGNQIVVGTMTDLNESRMETPLQSVPYNSIEDRGGFLVRPK